MSNRVLVVQHQDDCPPALFADWLVEAGMALDVRRPYRDETLPHDLHEHDGLLVLGGTMGAHDDAQHPWLTPTKHLLRHGAETGRPTLGVCLGHQLAAVALGGTSTPNPRGQTAGVRPIGWHAAAWTDALFASVCTQADAAVPHWNSDVVARMPRDTTVLATTSDAAPQVIRLAPTAWGVQFHPEADHAVVSAWVEADRDAASRSDGLDVEAALQEIKDSEARLHRTGRSIAAAFAAVVRDDR